jgi:hypothetical protein
LIKRLICLIKGHKPAYSVDYSHKPLTTPGTAEDIHWRGCERCLKPEARACLTWTHATREVFRKAGMEPRAIVDARPNGVVDVVVTAIPAPKAPKKPAGRPRKAKKGRRVTR